MQHPHTRDFKSAVNTIEVYSLDPSFDRSLVLEELTLFLEKRKPNAEVTFRVLEMVRDLSTGDFSEEERSAYQALRHRAYRAYFKHSIDYPRFNRWVPEVNQQIQSVIREYPQAAAEVWRDLESLESLPYLLGNLGYLGRTAQISELDEMIEMPGNTDSHKRARDSAREAKLRILSRAFRQTLNEGRSDEAHQYFSQFLRDFQVMDFETEKHSYGENARRSAWGDFLEAISRDAAQVRHPEFYSQHLDEMHALLRKASSDPVIRDYRLPSYFGAYGNEESISILRSVAGHSSRGGSFREAVHGIQVRDALGNKVMSGGAIRRIQDRLK